MLGRSTSGTRRHTYPAPQGTWIATSDTYPAQRSPNTADPLKGGAEASFASTPLLRGSAVCSSYDEKAFSVWRLKSALMLSLPYNPSRWMSLFNWGRKIRARHAKGSFHPTNTPILRNYPLISHSTQNLHNIEYAPPSMQVRAKLSLNTQYRKTMPLAAPKGRTRASFIPAKGTGLGIIIESSPVPHTRGGLNLTSRI